MSSVAPLIVKEHINALVDTAYGVHCEFYPGKFAAPGGNNTMNGIYTVVPNRDYTQPYIRMDAMRLQLSHPQYLKLQDALDSVLNLNSENPHTLTTLYGLMTAGGYRLQDLIVRASDVSPNDFIEGTDYYTATLDILIHYAAV